MAVHFIFRCQTVCRIYKTGESESKRQPFTCPGICTSRIPLISIHADKDRSLPRIGNAVPFPVRGHNPQRDYISVFLFFLSAAAANVAAGTIMFSWAFLPGEPFWVRAYHWQAGLYGLLDLTERAAKGYSLGFGIKNLHTSLRLARIFYSKARTSLFFRHTPCRCQATHTTTLSLDAWFKKKLPPIWKPQENIKILSQGKLANPPIYTA